MNALFNDLSDAESEYDAYGDSFLEEFRGTGPLGAEFEQDSESDDYYTSCDEEECIFGPDLYDPELYNPDDDDELLQDPILAWRVPSPSPSIPTTPVTATPIATPPIILPIRRKETLILPPGFTAQAVDALRSTESLALTLPKGRKQNSIGARIAALSLRDHSVSLQIVYQKTGVSESALSRLRTKADSRGWRSGTVVEVEHVDDKPRSGRPTIPPSIVDLIIKTVTKNSTTRG
jgi:hypothetical protein